jgi:hypothetical protein
MKKLLPIALIACFNLSLAQEKVKLEMAYLPNHQYNLETKSLTTILMDAQVDEATKKQLASAGMAFPLKMEMVQEVLVSQKTDAVNDKKEIPITMEYLKMDIKQSMAGKEMPTGDNPLKGAKISGFVGNDNKLRFENYGDGQIDEQMKTTIAKMIDQLQTNIQFPLEPMKIGDQFEQTIPMEMPIQGSGTLKMNSKTIYKLLSVQSGLANFDLVQTITMDMNMEQGGMSADGSGTGKMTFDVKKKFMSTYNSNIDMEMLIKAGGMDMNMKTNTVTDVKVSHL